MTTNIKLLKTEKNLNAMTTILGEKDINKIFSKINCNASLEESLNTFTKIDLTKIKQNLNISAASSLNKCELINRLSEIIKTSIKTIYSVISEDDRKFLKLIMQQRGLLKYKNNFLESIFTLRLYGLIITVKFDNNEKYILIPQDLRPELNELLESAVLDNCQFQ